MITRLWRGWTTPANAERYENLIRSTIFPGILGRGIKGLQRLELHRLDADEEIEFLTIMRFVSQDAVIAFAGSDWEASVVPPAARALLSRHEARARHYRSLIEQSAQGEM